jgi:hypothetical protein
LLHPLGLCPPSGLPLIHTQPLLTYLIPLVGLFMPLRNNLLSRSQLTEQAEIKKKKSSYPNYALIIENTTMIILPSELDLQELLKR